jgi:predicted membrane protein
MRLRWVLLWLIVVIVLFSLFVAEITEAIRLTDIISYFFVFVLALVIIAVLAVIGAAFMGVFISHRIFSVKSFTPFEEEMLQMRREVREIKKKVDEMAEDEKV